MLKIFPLIQGEMVIGSDPQCTIHIDSLAVQAQHAVAITHGDTTLLRDLGSTDGTFVNNKRIEGDHELKDNDLIRVGKHNLSYAHEAGVLLNSAEDQQDFEAQDPEEEEDEEDRTITRKRLTGSLQFMSGSNLGRTVSLNRNLTNIGKAGYQLAVITRRADGYYITHLEGKLPTLVNKEELGDNPRPLDDGDMIIMGNVKMQFFLE